MATVDKLQRERDYLLVIGVQSQVYLGISKRDALASPPVDSLIIDSLNIKFSIHKSKDNKKTSNKGTISVYNLSDKSIAFLNSSKLVNVSFYAGYKDSGMDSLVMGNVTLVSTEKEGGNKVTTLTLDENFIAINNTTVTSTIPGGKTIEDVIEVIRVEMSKKSEEQGGPPISRGLYQGEGKNSKVLYGYSLTGNARQKLDEIGLAYKIEWSIDNGKLNIQDEGNVVSNNKARTFVISPDTGLIDIPYFKNNEVTVTLAKPIKTAKIDKTTGKKKTSIKKTEKLKYVGVEFMALLNPFLRPGDLVKIECEQTKEFIDKYYQVRNIEYYGELRANPWYIKCFCDEVTIIG